MLAEGTEHDTADAALGTLISEVCDGGVKHDEVNRAKSKTKADEAFGRDGPYMVAAQLNEAIAAGDWKLFAGFAERIDRVTASDVQRVAQRFLIDDKKTTGYYIPTVPNEQNVPNAPNVASTGEVGA